MSTTHYLSLPRTIAYQIASVLFIGTGGLASAALKSYTNDQVLASSFGAKLNNASILSSAAVVVSSGALAGTLAGMMFLIMLFIPNHGESKRSVLIKQMLFGVLSIFSLVAALVATIITATGTATLDTTGLSPAIRAEIITQLGGTLAYKISKESIAYSVLAWLCTILLFVCAFLAISAAQHVLANGPANPVETIPTERWATAQMEKWSSRKKVETTPVAMETTEV